MPRSSYRFDVHDSETEPAAVVVRANAEDPQGAIERARKLVDMAPEMDVEVEAVGPGFIRVKMYENRHSGEYIDVLLNLNNLRIEHLNEGETEEE